MNMALNLVCSRCGEPIAVTDEMLEEAQELGVPFNPVHEKCPNVIDKPLRNFRVSIHVYEMTKDENDPEDVETVEVARFGGDYEGESFASTLPKLQAELNKGWEQVQKMARIIDSE